MKTKSANARRLEGAIQSANYIINNAEREVIGCEETIKGLLREEDKEVYREQIKYYQGVIEREKKDILQFQDELSKETEIEVNDTFYQDELKKMNGLTKWEVNRMLDSESNRIPESNGYFGDYTLITFYGKQAIVYVDDRNAKAQFMTPFYDQIYYGRKYDNKAVWDADMRWGNAAGASIVIRNGDKYNLINRTNGGQPLCDEWFVSIPPTMEYDQKERIYYFAAIRENGDSVKLAAKGYIIRDIAEELAAAKAMSREEIFEKWVKAGKLVVGGCGWEYRGAGTAIIPTEKAIAEFHKYSFGIGFYELEWTTYNGQVALSMREYSELDME